jgi:hypothetical protein
MRLTSGLPQVTLTVDRPQVLVFVATPLGRWPHVIDLRRTTLTADVTDACVSSQDTGLRRAPPAGQGHRPAGPGPEGDALELLGVGRWATQINDAGLADD